MSATACIVVFLGALVLIDIGFVLGAWWASRRRDGVIGARLSSRHAAPEEQP